jgi:hypothetical protein
MSTIQIQVTDTRGKYPAKTYAMEVDPKEPFLAEMDAVQRFITEMGHPPPVVGKSGRAYYARFRVATIKGTVAT